MENWEEKCKGLEQQNMALRKIIEEKEMLISAWKEIKQKDQQLQWASGKIKELSEPVEEVVEES